MPNAAPSSLVRTRWAAIGAAVAVTLGGGGIMFVDAAKDSGDRPVTVLLDEPCRIRDTRPDKAVGGRTTPLGEAEAYEISALAGAGDCQGDIPGDAVGLITNVTATGATANTNLRLYPKGAALPEASNLNPRGGGDPVTNAVTVGVDGTGTFIIRNNKGTVHVTIDVAGYLVHHTHDDTYVTYTGTIPSGVTVVGNFGWDSTSQGPGDHAVTIDFPAAAPVALTDATVNVAADANADTTDDDASCTGTVAAPTAPAGKVCIYVADTFRTTLVEGRADYFFAQHLDNRGFTIKWSVDAAAGLDVTLNATWAYTAP